MSDTPGQGTRFAVYLVPPAEDAFYQLGSAALGYDVRARAHVTQLPEVQPEWIEKAGQYGFHATLVEAFECDPASFPAIEQDITDIMACLAPQARLHLGRGRTEIWDDGTVIVRRFDANETLLVLHTLLLARLARFVTGSSFERAARADGKYAAPHEWARMRLFRTPRGLDSFRPHFTLVEPYTGGNAEELAARLDARFEPYATLEFSAVTLLRQDGTAPFRVVRDIPLAGAS